MKKCCRTCSYYTPTFFGYYKGEVGDGKCDVDDLCTAEDDFCECYERVGSHIVIECDDNEPPF